MKQRIDTLLFANGHAPTKSQAKQLILQGKVFYNGKQVKKCGQIVDNSGKLEVQGSLEYVSRGARKIEHAFEHWNIDCTGFIVADIGASTGGFTDYVLQQNAQKVYAIDVGHNQLASKLKNDSRVINMEGENIRYLENLPEKVDLVVCDISFISLRLVLHNMLSLLKENAKAIILFKPQFEGGPDALNKQGIVKNDEVREKILNDFATWTSEQNICIEEIIPSPISGKEGNREYLILIKT